jgi:hypothetical protein
MPERWERELRKIGDLQPNERSVRARTAEGPSGARPRGRRERLLAGIVGVAVFAAAVAFSWDAFVETARDVDTFGGGADPEGPALTIIANAQPGQEHAPDARARYGEVEATIPVQGGDGWDIGNAFPAAMFGPHEAAIPVGAPVVFESNAESVEVGFNQAYPDGDLVPQELSSTGMAALPSEPGEVLIQLSATWPEGRAEFSVFVNLYEPADVLDVDCRAHRVPVWQSPVVRAQPDGVHATLRSDASREVRIDAPGFTSGPFTTLEPGSSTLEIPVPPGIATISCNNAPASQFTVMDPEGLWVPSGLGCPPEDDVLPVKGEIDERLIDESVIVRQLLALEGSDQVLAPGYPDSVRALPLPSRVMVRRDGEVVAKIDVWLGRPARIEGEVCSSSGIHPRSITEPSPNPVAPAGGVAEDAAPALRVRCGPDGTQVLTPVVETQPDGLHVVPVGVPHGWSIGITTEDRFASFWSGSEGVNDPFVRSVPTGELVVACTSEAVAENEKEWLWSETARFRFVDQRGYFAPFNRACETSETTGLAFSFDAGGSSDLVEQIRGALIGVDPTDAVEQVAYPDPTVPSWWIVVRDGRTVAMAVVMVNGRSGAGAGWACPGSGISGNEAV